MSFNRLAYLPTNIGYELVKLKRLSVQLNKIRSLPTSIGEMRSLQQLDAHFNELQGLPLSFGRLTNLEILNLHCIPLLCYSIKLKWNIESFSIV